MIYSVDQVIQTLQDVDGHWEAAKPLTGPLWLEVKSRIKAAWAIVKGNAVAVR